MADGFKYIAFEGPLHQEIILFPNTRDHARFASLLGIKKEDMLGAGFVSMNADNPPSCWGHSQSLGIKSRGLEDTRLLMVFSGYLR